MQTFKSQHWIKLCWPKLAKLRIPYPFQPFLFPIVSLLPQSKTCNEKQRHERAHEKETKRKSVV